MKPVGNSDAAYLAGIIDGEGCVAVVRQKSKTCRAGFSYRAKLHVANSSYDLMVWLQKTLGVGWLKQHTPKMRNSKTQWGWEISGDEASMILVRVYPHLKIKRRQAELVIELQERKRACGRGHQISDGHDRELLYQESRFLNHRGAAPYTPESRIFSPRSTDDGPDVQAIAVKYGGGGHARAAGFKASRNWEGEE